MGPCTGPAPPVRHFVRLRFLHGALDSRPLFPARAASGQRFLTAAAAGVPCGVVSALAGPSSWRTGVVLVVASVGYGFCCPLSSTSGSSMSRRVSVCVGPNCSTPPRVVPPPGHLWPAVWSGCRLADVEITGVFAVTAQNKGGARPQLPGSNGCPQVCHMHAHTHMYAHTLVAHKTVQYKRWVHVEYLPDRDNLQILQRKLQRRPEPDTNTHQHTDRNHSATGARGSLHPGFNQVLSISEHLGVTSH